MRYLSYSLLKIHRKLTSLLCNKATLIQQKKIWMQGLSERPAPKLLNHENLFMLRASFFHLAELATSEFWLKLHHSRRPKQTFIKYASLFYEPGATKLSFFLQQWPKKGAFPLTGMWSGNPLKNDVSNYGINLKEIIQQIPITILPMFLAGEFSD